MARLYQGKFWSYAFALPMPWWVDHLLVPVIFVLLGAGITFAATQMQTLIERRRAESAFLRAIRIELTSLDQQLQASLNEVTESKARLERNQPGVLPQLVGTLRTTVFTTQLGTLKDLSDPLLMEIVKLYADLPILQQMIERLNAEAEPSGDAGIQQLMAKQARTLSVMVALSVQLNGFLKQIRALLSKLS